MIGRKVIQPKFSNVGVNKAIFPFMVMGFIYLLLLIARLTTGSAIADGSCEGVQTSLSSSHLHFKDPQFEVGRCGVLKATMKSQLNTPQIAKVELLEKISLNSTEKLANSALPISLHSRPSSTRKLFLDFNGYSIPSSSAWNDYWKGNDVRGLSFDSNYSDFSAAENAYIQDIWRAVSEDFSAFNIDVTTEDPGLAGLTRSSESDVYFGAHAVISDDYSQSAVCGCGGVAYVGVVDYIFSSFGATNPYSPNFNFVSFSSGNYVSAADAAGIVSHETGHNLGLGHDGNDSTGYYPGHANGIWAPIMGTSYNKSISQWSKNENRSGQVTSWTQRANSEWIFPSDCTESPSCRDDFLVISENNIPLMVDDYGNEPANSYLVTSKNFSILGYVGANEDEDWFKITADGPIKLSATVTATEKYPNLDIELILKGSNGATLASNNPLVTRNLNGQPAGVNAALSDQMLDPGTYYLIIRGTGALNPLDTGYSRYASVGKFTLNGVIVNRAKTAQTITFAPPAALLSTAFPYTLTATASSGLVPVITSSTTGVCTVSGFTLTMVSAGTCTVVANQAGNATYAPAAAISRSITLTKVAQTITFAPPATLLSTAFPYTLTATASSGLVPVITSSTTGVCTVSGFTLTMVSAGTCTVVANQAGNATYSPAAAISRSITLTKVAQTITFAPPATLLSTAFPYTLTATASSGLVPVITSSTTGVCTVSGFTLTMVSAGTCTVVANQAGNATYAPAAAISRSITLTKVAQTITFAPPATLLSTAFPYTLTATASSGLVPVITSSTTGVCTVSGFTLTMVSAGTCTVVANQAGNATYSPAAAISRRITLTKVAQTITFAPPATLLSTAFPYTLTATASSGLVPVITSSTTGVCTVSGFTLTMVSAGTCTVVANQAGNATYAPAAAISRSITLTKVAQTITFAPPATLLSTAFPYTLTATASSGLVPVITSSTTGVCTVSGFTLTMVSAGTCTVVANQAGNATYSPAAAISRRITLTKVAQTITFAPPATLLSTAFPYTLTATASSGLVPVITSSTTGVCTVSGFTLTMVSAGTCTVVANQAGNATYSPAAAISRSITLSLAPQISLRINNLIRDIFLGNSIDLTVSGGSGTGAISFKASGTGCTVSGARLSATSAATCSVIATKAANSQFLKAESPPVLFNFRSIAGLTIGNLLWSEEFVGEQGGSIDSNKWSARNCHRVPDSLGGGACFGSEAAYYAPSAIKLDGSIDGLAVIQTSRVSNSLPADAGSCLSDSCSFVSGRFDTHGKVGFKYGYIEARIKMPQGSGNHPAFWMLGNNINQVGWPLSGEMDITEIHSNFPKVTTSATHYSSSNVPFTCCSNHFYQVGERNVGVDLSLDFHLYAIAWQPNIIRYYVDGLLVATSTPATLKGNWHFDKAFFLIFNNTVNSEFSGTWENLVSSQMSIDWVRSYTVNGFGEVQIY